MNLTHYFKYQYVQYEDHYTNPTNYQCLNYDVEELSNQLLCDILIQAQRHFLQKLQYYSKFPTCMVRLSQGCAPWKYYYCYIFIHNTKFQTYLASISDTSSRTIFNFALIIERISALILSKSLDIKTVLGNAKS